jgi:hypothetical protein
MAGIANAASLSAHDYTDLLSAWIEATHPGQTLLVALGPLVKQVRHVTKEAVLRLLPLVDALIKRGGVQGVIHAHRFEVALVNLVEKKPSIVGKLQRFVRI